MQLFLSPAWIAPVDNTTLFSVLRGDTSVLKMLTCTSHANAIILIMLDEKSILTRVFSNWEGDLIG